MCTASALLSELLARYARGTDARERAALATLAYAIATDTHALQASVYAALGRRWAA